MNSAQGQLPEGPASSAERRLQEMNEALLVSSIRQHELAEDARRAEALLRQREADLRSHTDELDRFNRLAVDRESRILELKRSFNELALRHGETPPYVTDFDPQWEAAAARPSAPRGPSAEALSASGREDTVSLEAILRTDQLHQRPSRSPDFETENRALIALIHSLAGEPAVVLRVLTETILDALHAGSAGVSLLTADGTRFYWPEIAGEWKPYVGGGTPRDFGPCGDVLDRDSPLLFGSIEQRYAYFLPATPRVTEALLVPFHLQGEAVGTIWAVMHDDRHFDAEDLRQLESFAKFAAAAYQAAELVALSHSRGMAALSLMEDAVESRHVAEAINEGLRRSEERYRVLFDERTLLEEKTRMQSEALADLNRRKDEFLAMLSHELRNPLAAILNAIHLLQGQRDRNPVQVEAHRILDRQVAQLRRLVDDLLEVSRISTGRIHLQMECVDLCAIVNLAVETIKPQVRQGGLSLTKQLTGRPVWVQGDSVRLEQVIVNLLNNAVKYTDGGGAIGVQLTQEADEASLCVSDTGVGIAPAVLPHIFDLFTQADESLDHAQGGLGIGLSLVHSLVTMHRGRVEVHSEPGRGSRFVVTLPVCTPPETSLPVAVVKARFPVHELKVLVVDDNQDAALSIAMLLRALGHDTRIVHDGAAAMRSALEDAPDVMLLDIALPQVNGLQVAKWVRTQASLRRVVLIALTGHGQEADRLRSLDAGFDHHFVKPMDFDQLEGILSGIGTRS